MDTSHRMVRVCACDSHESKDVKRVQKDFVEW